jgi:hypothetical protein
MSASPPFSPLAFIDDRGGPTSVAKATGHKVGAVNLWRHRNKIPRTAWPEVMLAFPDLSMPDLLEMEKLSGRDEGVAA